MGEPIRLQKILAAAGMGSRRACEVFITDGRVTVDNTVVSELGSKADPESQTIALDGQSVAGPGRVSKTIREAEQKVYWMLNKPKSVLCTNEDPAGRKLAAQLVPEKRRIYCVGRLDLDTEGLILLTNDGTLTNQLTHPRYGVEKTYVAKVEGHVSPAQIQKLEHGMHLAEGRTQGARVRIRKLGNQFSVVELTIAEGMNRQVRRMLARVELRCRNLKRVAIGPLRLGELPTGEARQLTQPELEQLKQALAHAEAASKTAAYRPKPARIKGQRTPWGRDPLPVKQPEESLPDESDSHLTRDCGSNERFADEDINDEISVAGNDREPKKPWQKRPNRDRGGEWKPWENRPVRARDGAKKPWQKRPERSSGGTRKPWESRPERDRGSSEKPWRKRPERDRAGAAKPWQDRGAAKKPWQRSEEARPPGGPPKARTWEPRGPSPRRSGFDRAGGTEAYRTRPWEKPRQEGGERGAPSEKPKAERQRSGPGEAHGGERSARPWERRK